MKCTYIITTLTFALSVTAENYTFTPTKDLTCTGADDGYITCERQVGSSFPVAVEHQQLFVHQLLILTNKQSLKPRDDEPNTIEKRAVCELGGTKACFTECFAEGCKPVPAPSHWLELTLSRLPRSL